MRNDTKLDLLWEEVEELKKTGGGGGSDLPDVTIADNGKILGVVNGAWNKMDAPTGGVDYSTTEQNTGIKWIDGKDIYRKTFQFTTANSTNYEHYSTGMENIDFCNIDFSASGVFSSETVFIPAVSYAAKGSGTTPEPNCFCLLINKIDGVLNIDYNAGSSTKDKSAIVTLLYTKATTETKKRKTTK